MRATLLTTSCTKGWLSWGHGELWITDTDLCRIGKSSLTLAAGTKGGAAAGALGAVIGEALRARIDARSGQLRPDPERPLQLSDSEWQGLLSMGKDVDCLPLQSVRSGKTRKGPATTSLRLILDGGQKRTFLWSNSPKVLETVRRLIPAVT